MPTICNPDALCNILYEACNDKSEKYEGQTIVIVQDHNKLWDKDDSLGYCSLGERKTLYPHGSEVYYIQGGKAYSPSKQPRMTDEDYNVTQDTILKDIPAEFHAPLSIMAYEQGHSAGHSEVLMILENLVYMLHDPIVNYHNRIKTECER